MRTRTTAVFGGDRSVHTPADTRPGSERRPVLVVAGPEGVPKLDTTVALAKRFDGEVISASSTQVSGKRPTCRLIST